LQYTGAATSLNPTPSVVVGLSIGVDLAGILEGRMARAEGGSVPSGVEYGEGCPLSSRLRDLGSVVSSPGENGFWCILKATDALFCTYMTKSERDNLY